MEVQAGATFEWRREVFFCLVITREAKRFSLIFPEGKGHLRG